MTKQVRCPRCQETLPTDASTIAEHANECVPFACGCTVERAGDGECGCRLVRVMVPGPDFELLLFECLTGGVL